MKIFSVILCFIMMLSLLCLPADAYETGEAYEELPSDAFREAYRLLEEGIAGMAPVINLPEELQIHYDELLDVARSVCLDHPEYFWFLESWFYEFGTHDSKFIVTSLTPTYYLDHERVSAGSQLLAEAMIAFREKVDEIIIGIPANYTTEYEIALYLHDYLAENVTYTLEGDHDSAYAALVHGRAACYGYSKAYQYLLSQAGIRSRIIVGDSVADDGSTGGHAWNQVWIDGVCYYTDVTWDDLDSVTTHRYFMMSLEDISRDHIADDLFALADCDHSLDYYQLSEGYGVGTVREQTNGRTFAQNFRLESYSEDQGAVFVCDARFDCDFDSWMFRNTSDILAALKLSHKTQISYYYFDDVYYLIFEDPTFKPNYRKAETLIPEQTNITLKGTGAQFKLIPQIEPYVAGIMPAAYSSDNESVAVVGPDGMITAVSPGVATITVTSYDGLASGQCVVNVEAGDAHEHELRLIPESNPTCELDGNESYYICTGCFHRFADAQALHEITDIADFSRPPTGHKGQLWGVKPYSHFEQCICGLPIAQTTAPHVDEDGDDLCDVCSGRMPTKSDPVSQTNEKEKSDWAPLIWTGVGVAVVAVIVFVVIRRRIYGYVF